MTAEEVLLEWLLEADVPRVVFLVALLTSPSRWTNLVVSALRQRFGSQEGNDR